MPIERTFAQKGFGTVVTGTPLDGAIRVGEEVELVPGGQVGRVRGIQRFLREATEGSHGQCLAINVPELGREPPVRGQVLCQPGFLKAGVCFGVHLRTVPGLVNPLANAETVKFHTGTDEKTAKLYLLENRLLPAGQTGFAVAVLAHPVAAAVHDRFIIRRPSPAATVAGGGILAVLPDAHHVRKKQVLDALKERHALFAEVASYRPATDSDVDLASLEGIDREIAYLLRTQYPVGASLRELACAALLPDGVALESLSRLGRSLALPLQPEYFISEEVYCARRAEVETRIREAAEKESLSLRLSDLRKGFEAWPAPLWNAIRRDLESGQQVGIRGDRLVLHEAVAKLNEADRTLMAALLQIYENTAFHSPRPDELPALVGGWTVGSHLSVHAAQVGGWTTGSHLRERVDRLLDLLCSDGKLVRVAKTVVLSYNVFKRAQDMVVQTLQERGVLDSADFKHSIQSSRKYALAILDCLDTRRVTVRSGNDRRLAANYQRNLVT
jgi:selenocysteine-specific elongation factor